MGPLKKYWDEGKLAIFLGIGYPHPSYSHFRSMDIWHTCEPDTIGVEGWLGRAMKEIDPQCRKRADRRQFWPWLAARSGQRRCASGFCWQPGYLWIVDWHPGPGSENTSAGCILQMYGPTIGTGYTMDYIRRTGIDALKGADVLATAPSKYSSR